MVPRLHHVCLLAGAFLSMGFQFATPNFVVDAPTPQIAQQIGQHAEYYRKEKALLWLGYEMPQWPRPCPVQVKVTMGGSGGDTSFVFDHGQVLEQHMRIQGSLDRLLVSVLPHEVTHTIFAYYFRCPVPRWSDEGGAVLSEDELERRNHDQLVRQILNSPGRAIPLRRLFTLRDYPSDMIVLYAEGFSVSDFLVERSNRPAFLAFVAMGMREGWDQAARVHYRFNSVEELEQAWLSFLRTPRRAPQPTMVARNPAPPQVESERRIVVRQTIPPMLVKPVPVVRGQAPDVEVDRLAARSGQPRFLPGFSPQSEAARPPTPFPPPSFSATAAPRDPWQPAATNPQPPVRFGTPQVLTPPAQAAPNWPPPVNQSMAMPGYPN